MQIRVKSTHANANAQYYAKSPIVISGVHFTKDLIYSSTRALCEAYRILTQMDMDLESETPFLYI